MVIKARVTEEEKAFIEELAKREGRSVSSLIRDRLLKSSDYTAQMEPVMKYIEEQSKVALKLNEVASAVLKNKVIYETEILDMLDRMTEMEKLTAGLLKEVQKYGNFG